MMVGIEDGYQLSVNYRFTPNAQRPERANGLMKPSWELRRSGSLPAFDAPRSFSACSTSLEESQTCE